MRNLLVIIRGAPGAGKSTLARNLVSLLNKKYKKIALLIPDEFKWVMTAHKDRSADDIGLAYINYEFALRNYLKKGYCVITEDTWDIKPFQAERVVSIGSEYSYETHLFLLKATLETIKHQNTLRPMVLPKKQLEDQYYAIYNKTLNGETTIDISNKQPEQIAEELIAHLD